MTARGFPSDPGLALAATGNFQIQIAFADGGVRTVHYAADSPAGPGKERFETSAPGGFGVIDHFRRGAIWTGRDKRGLGGRRQDKGFAAQYALLAKMVHGEAAPPSPAGYHTSTLATLAAVRSLETRSPETVVEHNTAVDTRPAR